MKTCFVVCPIGPEGSDTRKRSDKLLKFIIEPICKNLGFEVIRVDNINQSDRIDQTIFQHLSSADLVIADLTDHNPNAFYEIGFRTALNKPFIHLAEEGHTLPFDVSSTRTFYYAFDIEKTTVLQERLTQTIQSFSFDTNESESYTTDSVPTNSDVLQLLYSIHDNILDLRDEIRSKDNSAISTLASHLTQQASHQNSEVALMNMFGNLLSTPAGMDNLLKLIELSQTIPKK